MIEIGPKTLLYVFLSVILLHWIVIYLVYRNYIKSKNSWATKLKEVQSYLEAERKTQVNAQEKIHNLEIEANELSLELKHLGSINNQLIQERDNDLSRFQIIAQKIIDEKSIHIETQQKKGLEQILTPLKDQLNRFENKVEKTNKEHYERTVALKTQLQHLYDLNQQVTQEANNLTKALKGDVKTQGTWGEIILENILEKSGLEKNREYFIQSSIKNSEGKVLRPDVIIKLPDHKRLIIDSKVSLKSYESYINANEEIDAQKHLHSLCASIKKHIDGLSTKKYHELYDMESPDFVLMFIPIDTAFTAALQGQPTLYEYAFDQNIVIVTSSTLLAVLKTVDSMWNNEKHQQNALEIAKEAGKMYDKFVAFTEDLNKIEQRLMMTQSHIEDAKKKLFSGKGNLINRANKIKALGAKANKTLTSTE